MRKPTLIESRDVALAEIHIEQRQRNVDPAAVLALVTSIEEVGLKDRVTLRRVRNKKRGKDQPTYILKLVAGGHRVDAFHQMGREAIPAEIWECTDDFALLLEIDDNLARAELTPLDKAVFLVRRKHVYERMYPETKHGAKGRAIIGGVQNDNLSLWSFVEATAHQTGQSKRTIERMIAAARGLTNDEIEALRAAPKQVTIADLETIAKCEPKHRPGIVFGLATGTAKSAAEALAMLTARPGDKVVDPIDAKVRPLNDMFARAPKAVMVSFVRQNADRLRAILAEMEEG